jgi:hypothetical protein
MACVLLKFEMSFFPYKSLNNGLCVLLKFKMSSFSYKSLNSSFVSFSKVSNVFIFSYKSLNNGLCVFFQTLLFFLSTAQQWFCVLLKFQMSSFSYKSLNNGLCPFLNDEIFFPYKSLNNGLCPFLKFKNVFYFPINRSTVACVLLKFEMSFFSLSIKQWLVSF